MTNDEISAIRKEFPQLERTLYGHPLVYLDNAATTQSPMSVTDEILRMEHEERANVHRGVHTMSQNATTTMERAREAVRRFINAESADEVIFTSGTTDSINLVASSLTETFENGDEIILSAAEHHSNIVPWQLAGRSRRLHIKVIPLLPDGSLDMDAYRNLFTERTRFVSVAHASNVLGTVNPVKEIVSEAHRNGVPVLIDGAQAVAHTAVDVRDIDADFYAFSAHKMYGPTGVGVLYGKRNRLLRMPPGRGGGAMIDHVSFEKTTFADLPHKFEAGTPNIVGVAAFAKAVEFVERIGFERIAAHEQTLLASATEQISSLDGIRVYGTAKEKCAVLSFNVANGSSFDVGTLLDKLGVEVRTGHHCAQPLMERLGVTGTVRASFAVYNTLEDVDIFIAALHRVASMLG